MRQAFLRMDISIHALREEGDLSATGQRTSTVNFYPRPPRGGRRCHHTFKHFAREFLSTPSARRATLRTYYCHSRAFISIHALREEGDGYFLSRSATDAQFLSTPSARRATEMYPLWVNGYEFLSTPSARRATSSVCVSRLSLVDFYPRPPRGGRRPTRARGARLTIFLSTPSARRATRNFLHIAHADVISIHALREEGDLLKLGLRYSHCDFYPRPPRGGRRLAGEQGDIANAFLSTPSARRATAAVRCIGWDSIFLSTPSARRATCSV